MTPRPLPPLVLASASPRRRELLGGLGLRFLVEAPDVDETSRASESPEGHVQRLSRMKAEAIRKRRPDALVLAADTIVVVDEASGPEILGKPAGAAEARAMLRRLAGREHRVLTGLALYAPDDACSEAMRATRVCFAPLDDRRIEWYVATGEPMDKAGAYGIQGNAALLIDGIQGSWTNVVGLPLDALPELFARLGYDLFDALG